MAGSLQEGGVLIGAIVTAFITQSTPPPTDPLRRVVPGEQQETKTIYRELKDGEQRVEGLLRRIDCPRGQVVTFTLHVKDKPMRFTAPALASVDYIAHTPDFRGPVTCGGKTPPDHVYLTWKLVNGTSRAIAVEFLPR
jgi:hypothetical protein